MAAKHVHVPDIGDVVLYKRKGVRSVRLSIDHNGTIKVTVPTWAPYRLGIEFVKSRADWIQSKATPKPVISYGDRIGKAHRIYFRKNTALTKPSSRISGTSIVISLPEGLESSNAAVQAYAEQACLRALKKEAQQLLPQRLSQLAQKHGFTFREVTIKRLKTRWGSCTSQRDISLNSFLMQLPWHLIDYVLLHELTHTKIMAHGRPFWHEMAKYVPDVTSLRKEIKQYRPSLTPVPITSSDTAQSRVSISVD